MSGYDIDLWGVPADWQPRSAAQREAAKRTPQCTCGPLLGVESVTFNMTHPHFMPCPVAVRMLADRRDADADASTRTQEER